MSQARFDGDRLALVVEVSHAVSTANRLTDRYYRMLTAKESGDPQKIRITVDELFVPAADTDSIKISGVSWGSVEGVVVGADRRYLVGDCVAKLPVDGTASASVSRRGQPLANAAERTHASRRSQSSSSE